MLSTGIRKSILTRKNSFQSVSPSNSRRGSIRKVEVQKLAGLNLVKKSKFAVNLKPIETDEDNFEKSVQRIFHDESQDSRDKDYLIRHSLELKSGKPAPRKALQLSNCRLMSNRFDSGTLTKSSTFRLGTNEPVKFPKVTLFKPSNDQGYLLAGNSEAKKMSFGEVLSRKTTLDTSIHPRI